MYRSINSGGISEFLESIQIWIFPRGVPTSALQFKLMVSFSWSSFGNTTNSSGSLAFAENNNLTFITFVLRKELIRNKYKDIIFIYNLFFLISQEINISIFRYFSTIKFNNVWCFFNGLINILSSMNNKKIFTFKFNNWATGVAHSWVA